MLGKNSYIDKQKMLSILREKIDEGYDILRNTSIENKEIGRMFMDMFELNKTIDQLEQEEAFDKEMANKEIEDALAKNKEVEVNE
jgi:hypothetical protein